MTYSWWEGEVLGPSSSVLEAGHLAVLWLILPCLPIIAAGRTELRPQEELLSGVSCWREMSLTWLQKEGDVTALSFSVVLGDSVESP